MAKSVEIRGETCATSEDHRWLACSRIRHPSCRRHDKPWPVYLLRCDDFPWDLDPLDRRSL